MTRYGTLNAAALLALFVLASCGKDNSSSISTSLSAHITDPCAIALTPHTGLDPEDQDILHLQNAARHAAEPTTYLERLGWAFIAKARVSFDPGLYKLAEQCALCIESKRPRSAEALLLRGYVLHHLHQFAQAEALARDLVARRGLWFDHGLLGDVLTEQGNLAEAVEAYQHMMDQKPGPQAYSRAAHIRWLKGDLSGAIELMQMTVGASGSRDPEAAAWHHVRLALYEHQAGHVQKAMNRIAAGLDLLPAYAPALLARGRMLMAQGNDAQAIPSLARAARLNPLPEYQWAFIEALRMAKRADEADAVEVQLMRRGAVDDPRTFALYLATTGRDIHRALGLAEAELEVRADVFTFDTLAWALSAAGRHSEARALSQRALAEGTQDARLFYHAGVIAMASGQNDEAARWLKKALMIQRMLLPSERTHLNKAFAALLSQEPTLAAH